MIAHLAHQDDIRGLPQHGADNLREVEPDVVPHLDLVDARQVVLDRVFGRDDLAVGPVQLVQRGVERGRLARAGRARDQDDAVRPADEVVEDLEVLAPTAPAAGRRP